MIIGLTGTSGSGKSTLAKHLEDKGFLIIDYDKLTHNLYENCIDCVKEISYTFEGVVNKNNKVDRKKLADIVFNDNKKLDILNQIVHKYVIELSEGIIKSNSDKNIILDAPLLFEANIDKICNFTVCTVCDLNIKTERIVKRDNISYEMARKRLENRISDEELSKKCNFVINTNNGINENDINWLLDKFNLGGAK